MIVIKSYQIVHDRNKNTYRIQSAEAPLCPDCGEGLAGYDTRRRHTIDATGASRWFHLRRLHCRTCGKLHLELPDFMRPRKHYEAPVIHDTLAGLVDYCPADDSTIRRWKKGQDPPGSPSKQAAGAVFSMQTDTKEETT